MRPHHARGHAMLSVGAGATESVALLLLNHLKSISVSTWLTPAQGHVHKNIRLFLLNADRGGDMAGL